MPLVVGVGVGASFGGLAGENPRPTAARISIRGMTPQMVPLKAGTSRALAVRSSAPVMAPIPAAAQISLSGKAVFIRPLPAAAVLAVQSTAPKPILLAPSAARLAIEGMAPAPASYPSNPNPASAYLELRQGGAPQVSPLRAGASRSLVMRGGLPPILPPIPAAARLALTGRPAFMRPVPAPALLGIQGATPRTLGLRPASAQLAVAGFAPVPASSSAAPTVAVARTYVGASSSATHTLSNVVISAGLVVVAAAAMVSGADITGVTVGGSSITRNAYNNGSGWQAAGVWSGVVSAGTYDIVVTLAGATADVEVVVYCVSDLNSTTPESTSANQGTSNVTLSVSDNSIYVVASQNWNQSLPMLNVDPDTTEISGTNYSGNGNYLIGHSENMSANSSFVFHGTRDTYQATAAVAWR